MEQATKIKIARGFEWGALGIVLLFAILAIIASPIAKHIVNTKGEAIIGRQLHAEHVRVNIYTGGVTLEEFQCFEPNGTTDFVYWDRLYVNIAYPRLLSHYVKIRHLHLDGCRAQVLQNKDKLNFSDIIERFTKNAAPADSLSRPWRVTLCDLKLTNSSLYYHDVLHHKEWNVENVNLSLPDLNMDNSETAGLDFVLPTGGKVVAQAQYEASANAMKFLLQLQDVNPNVVLPLVQDYINVSGIGAQMNGQLTAKVRLDDIRDISLNGNVTLQNLHIKDSYKNEVASLDEMRIVLNRADLLSRKFILDSLVLQGLTGRFEVHENKNTLSALLKKDDAKQKAKAKRRRPGQKQKVEPAPKPIVWTAKTAILTAHDMVYFDDSHKCSWSYSIQSLEAKGRNVSSNGRNRITMSATLTHNTKLKGDFTGGLDVKKQDTQFNLTLSNVRLKDFDALCRNYTGYPLESGILFAEMHMEFTGGQLTGNTRIVIDDPEVGKREKFTKAKYRDLPVRSTCKSLVNSDDRVIINAPVKADATKKNFSFGSVFTKSLIKETFGHMMKTKSKKDKISDDEREEIAKLIGEEDKPKKSKADKPKKDKSDKPKKDKSDKPKKPSNDKHRNDRNKKR